MRRLSALLVTLALTLPAGARATLSVSYWSDQFVVVAESFEGAPLLFVMDFNRGTSGVPGRERVAEFVGHACDKGRWFDLQSGEYPYPGWNPERGHEMERLVGNGVCRVVPTADRKGWILDYDGNRATFRVKTEEPVLLHVQRDDPEMTVRHAAARAVLDYGERRYPATVFHEHVRWRGYNRLVGKTPPQMYGHFDWIPLVTRRGDWFLLVQDPRQVPVPEDQPDHNWGVYRSHTGVIRQLARQDFDVMPVSQFPLEGRRQAPGGYNVRIPSLGIRGWLHDRGHFLDRFGSGMYGVVGALWIPGAGRRQVVGLVDHIEH